MPDLLSAANSAGTVSLPEQLHTAKDTKSMKESETRKKELAYHLPFWWLLALFVVNSPAISAFFAFSAVKSVFLSGNRSRF